MHEGQWTVVLICLVLAAYFLITGFVGIRSRKMTVVNPDHRSANPGILGLLIQKARSAEDPNWQPDEHNPSTVIEGKDAYVRGFVHILFGAVIVLIAAAYVWMEMP